MPPVCVPSALVRGMHKLWLTKKLSSIMRKMSRTQPADHNSPRARLQSERKIPSQSYRQAGHAHTRARSSPSMVMVPLSAREATGERKMLNRAIMPKTTTKPVNDGNRKTTGQIQECPAHDKFMPVPCITRLVQKGKRPWKSKAGCPSTVQFECLELKQVPGKTGRRTASPTTKQKNTEDKM